MSPDQLVAMWREDAATFERYKAEQLAEVCRRHADELDAAVHEAGSVALTLGEAARESGYSADRLRHMIGEGRVTNAGKKGSPRIRRADLPRKATKQGGTFDPAAVARRVRTRGGAE